MVDCAVSGRDVQRRYRRRNGRLGKTKSPMCRRRNDALRNCRQDDDVCGEKRIWILSLKNILCNRHMIDPQR